MRRLYPPRKGDRLEAEGRYRRADGSFEQWSRHRDASGRVTLRVETLPGNDLWHLVLAPDGRPERVEARLRHPEGVVEAALTCFEDEVLIWRRGAEPASETLDMPPGYRLFWPPVAGRAECLDGLESVFDSEERAAWMFLLLTKRPPARGGLRARPAKLGLLRGPELRLRSPGLPEMLARFDAHGDLVGWYEDGQPSAELLEVRRIPLPVREDPEAAT